MPQTKLTEALEMAADAFSMQGLGHHAAALRSHLAELVARPECPFALPVTVGDTYIEMPDGLPICSTGGDVAAANYIAAAINAYGAK